MGELLEGTRLKDAQHKAVLLLNFLDELKRIVPGDATIT